MAAGTPSSIEVQIDNFLEQFKRSASKAMDGDWSSSSAVTTPQSACSSGSKIKNIFTDQLVLEGEYVCYVKHYYFLFFIARTRYYLHRRRNILYLVCTFGSATLSKKRSVYMCSGVVIVVGLFL